MPTAEDRFRIDGHKLLYHVERVHGWLQGDNVYPVYVEISPTGACNHRCVFCGLDFMEYQRRSLDADMLTERLTEMAGLGVKSVMYAGEGEPLLHGRISEIIRHTKSVGIDAALTTNAVLLTEARARQLLPYTEWIKVSINGGTPDTYAAIHRTKPRDFRTVVDNMAAAARLKKELGARCALGMQMILLPENKDEAVTLAGIARDIGMDYLVVKPYSQHLKSHTRRYGEIRYADYLHLGEELQPLNTPAFSVVFRARAMRVWDEATKGYARCLALPFWSYIDSGGNVWGCSVYLGDERFRYGNINEQSFRDIWEGDKRRQSLRWVEHELDPCQCRVNCRMDQVNRYLWDLKNPPEHANFI